MKKIDKMDFLVILVTGLALYYFMFKAPPPQPPAPKVDAAAEKAKTADGKPAEATAATAKADAAAPETPAAPVAEELVEYSTAAATYTFTNLGGGLKTATVQPAPYAGKTPQELNLNALGAIGSLSDIEGEVDVRPWTVKEKTDKSITFEYTTKDSVQITKTWTLSKGDDAVQGPGYIWDLQVKFKNNGTEKFASDSYSLYVGTATQLHPRDAKPVMVGTFAAGKGKEIEIGAFNQGSFFNKKEPLAKLSESLSQLQWVSVNSQYYTTIITDIAKEKSDGKFWASHFDYKIEENGETTATKAMHAGLGLPMMKLEPSQEVTQNYQVFTGPRSGVLLGNVNEERAETMFYGMTGWLSKLFLWALHLFHDWTGSFGLAVVFLTICVRLVIWPLHIKSTRSMKRMGLLAPMMNEIKTRYKAKPVTPENQRAQQTEMMGLYREYGVNPVGGCLPLLLQMPIFFGYFGMLNHAVEMRGHSFLWAHDLTLPDTVAHVFGYAINPFPLLMTITMFIQMQLQPKPPVVDENQQMQMKIMKFMPFMFLIFCYSYASALALYWTVQNIISIFQTQLVKRMPEAQLVKRDLTKLPSVSGANRFGGPAEPEKPKGPAQPRIGGTGKSAFKK